MSAIETAEPKAAVSGRYLYAIVDGDVDEKPYGFLGLEGCPVYALSDGQLTAVVSNLPGQKLRPERRRLAAHHDVLKRLMPLHTVLPMVFGLVADSPDAVRLVLRQNRDALLAQLDRVRGHVEMGLRVTWDVPNIFEFLLGLHPDLKVFRDHVFRGARAPSYEEKIELGRHFEQTLSREREQHAETITQLLSPHCTEIILNTPREEREIAKLVCLVDSGRLREFENGVIEVAKRYDHHYAFDFNGPWPPHSFVSLELQW
ncbi:MAG: GvpL/GvpF family gas vesicle protein [Isosphaeraceae bacterium]|nr:GvpL/GvpF family gas vesicle protein [Isosphaeraceae bacterium]